MPNTAVVKVDPARRFQSLMDDELLGRLRIPSELGSTKNPNKNPVAEKAVQELEDELFHTNPSGGDTNPVQLAVSHCSSQQLNPKEWLIIKRNMDTAGSIHHTTTPMVDQELIHNQHESGTSNHQNSQRSKAPHARTLPDILIEVGDIVYLVADINKTRDRDHYLVIATYGPWCSISIFTGSQLCATVYRVKSLLVSRCHLITSPLIPLLQWHQTLRKITWQILQTPTRPACHSTGDVHP